MILDRKAFLRAAGLAVVARRVRAAAGVRTRWAMVVDTEKCRKAGNCTKCIDACHLAHNVPAIRDPRREVKWVWKAPFSAAFPAQNPEYTEDPAVLVLCNQCENPPCTRVCPTQSTWKREDGIVMMDWHRCIGCRYCVAACPYGSRSFNWGDPRPHILRKNVEFPTRTQGVVEKCNFCAERVERGQAPACVEACPEKAMTFGNLLDPQSAVRQLLRARRTRQRRPELGTRPGVFYIV